MPNNVMAPFSRIHRDRFDQHIKYAKEHAENWGPWDPDKSLRLIADIAALATSKGRLMQPQSEPTICLSLSVTEYVSGANGLVWLKHLLSDVDQNGILAARFGDPADDVDENDRSSFEWSMRMGYYPFLRMVPELEDDEVSNYESPRLQLITNGGFFLPACEPEENALASALCDYPEALIGLPGAGKLFDLWMENHPIKAEEVIINHDEISVEITGLDTLITVSTLDGMRVIWEKGARQLFVDRKRQQTIHEVTRTL